MAENKRGSNMEKHNSEAGEWASVITREAGRASPTLTLCPKLGRNPSVLGQTGKAQATQSLEADNSPLTWHFLKGFKKHIRDLLSCKSELLSHAQLKRHLSPGLASLSGWPRAAPAQECHMPKYISACRLTPPPQPRLFYP